MSSVLQLRPMTSLDGAVIAAAFAEQGWTKPLSQYQRYWEEMQHGARDVVVAEWSAEFAGYVTIVWDSLYPPFRAASIPEIADFNVLQRFQRRHVGTALMEAAEALAAERSPVVGLGVGLFADYGPAQILYARRGYVPDGRGLVSHHQHPAYGTVVGVDDDLVLYLIKRVNPTGSVLGWDGGGDPESTPAGV